MKEIARRRYCNILLHLPKFSITQLAFKNINERKIGKHPQSKCGELKIK